MTGIVQSGLPGQRLAPVDACKIGGLPLAGIALLLAANSGGIPALLMALALGLAIRAYQHPREVIVAGPLFLLAANVFLPSFARFGNFLDNPFETYFWAAGLLAITLGGVAGTGLRKCLDMPASLQAFLAAAIGASIYGLIHGNETSYVLRQLFGSLVFAAYFVLARHVGDEETFLKNSMGYVVGCALAFLAYYVWVFNELGIHKEITSLGTQAVMFGILFAVRGGWRGWAAAAILFAVPLALIQRRDLAVGALALALMLMLRARSKSRRRLWAMIAAVVVLFSLAPPLVDFLLNSATETKVGGDLLPDGARDSSSIEDRGLQLLGSALVVQRSPVFGDGMGSQLEWDSVFRGDMQQAYVDNGWAYLMTKMGLAGFLTFSWFLADLLRKMPGGSVPLVACLLSMLLLMMWAEPLFFQFTTSPYVGVVAGLLWAKSRPKPRQPNPNRGGPGSAAAGIREPASETSLP